MRPWLCKACKFLLGYLHDENVLSIKRKDLYVEVQGGKVTVNCCRCGLQNTVVDDKIQDGKEVNINGL